MAIYMYAPYDDELLHGWFHRYIKYMQVQALSHLRHLAAVNPDLEWWSRETAVCLGMSAQEMADTLTISPFMAAMRAEFKGGKELDHPARKVSCHVRLKIPRELRFCKDCFRLDALAGRHPYWRRSHQLPGVLLCHVHGEVLSQTRKGLRDRDRYDTDVAISTGESITLELTVKQRGHLVSLSRLANWVLRSSSGPVTGLAREYQFVTPDTKRRRIITGGIYENYFDYFGRSYLEQCAEMFGISRRFKLSADGRLNLLLAYCMVDSSWDFIWPKCVNTNVHPDHSARVSSVKRTPNGWTAACVCGCTFDYTRAPVAKGIVRFEVTNIRLPEKS